MKKHLFISLLIFSFIISLVLIKCTNSIITEPKEETNENSLTRLAKNDTGTVSCDSAIILSQSELTVQLGMDLPKYMVKQLDKYLSNKKNLKNTAPEVEPHALDCHWYRDYAWVYLYVFKGVPGKYLGIWNDYVDWQKLHDTYGFRMIYVDNADEQNTAFAAGFQYDSMMVRLHWFPSAYDEIEAAHLNNKHAGAYFIDEPFERETWTALQILNVEAYLANNYPGEKLGISSYKLHWYPFSWPTSYGDIYTSVLNSYGNEYIMCDQYHGDCNATVDGFWTDFRDYYGSYNCAMGNWAHVVINNGYGDDDCPGVNYANNWSDLLGDANESGVNKFWLYAAGTGDENAIKNFCQSAHARGWLYRLKGYYCTWWYCESPNPCIHCSYPYQGVWTLDHGYYQYYEWF